MSRTAILLGLALAVAGQGCTTKKCDAGLTCIRDPTGTETCVMSTIPTMCTKTCDTGMKCMVVSGVETCVKSDAPKPCDKKCEDGKRCTLVAGEQMCVAAPKMCTKTCDTGMKCMVVSGVETCVKSDAPKPCDKKCEDGKRCLLVAGEQMCVDAPKMCTKTCDTGMKCMVVSGVETCVKSDAPKPCDKKCEDGKRCTLVAGEQMCVAAPKMCTKTCDTGMKCMVVADVETCVKSDAPKLCDKKCEDGKRCMLVAGVQMCVDAPKMCDKKCDDDKRCMVVADVETCVKTDAPKPCDKKCEDGKRCMLVAGEQMCVDAPKMCDKKCDDDKRCMVVADVETCVKSDAPKMCDKKCEDGKRCMLVAGVQMCVDAPKMCDKKCDDDKRCMVVADVETCVKSDAPKMCDKKCEDGKRCMLVAGEQMCVDAPKMCDKKCDDDKRCIVVAGVETCVKTDAPKPCDKKCEDGKRCFVVADVATCVKADVPQTCDKQCKENQRCKLTKKGEQICAATRCKKADGAFVDAGTQFKVACNFCSCVDEEGLKCQKKACKALARGDKCGEDDTCDEGMECKAVPSLFADEVKVCVKKDEDATLRFDCDESKALRPWNATVRAFCCNKKAGSKACATDAEKATMAEKKKCGKVKGLTKAAKKVCCKKFGEGCETNDFDCTDRTVAWTEKQRDFCCKTTTDGEGCKVRCYADEERIAKQDPEDKEYCCKVRGNCNKTFLKGAKEELKQARAAFKGARKDLREKLSEGVVDADEIFANPKAVLRRLRFQLLAKSLKLRENPEKVLVTLIGILIKGEFPTGEQLKSFTVPVPAAWNTERHEEEREMKDELASTSRVAALLQAAADSGSDVYFDYSLEGNTMADVDASVQQLGAGANVVAEKQVSDDDDDDSSAGPFIAIGAVLGALCLGGLVAMTVFRKKESGPQFSELALVGEDLEMGNKNNRML